MRLLVPCVLVALAGCATVQGEFRPSSFVSASRSFSIAYVDPGHRRVLPAPWTVTNFSYDDSLPSEERTRGRYESELEWESSSGSSYRATTTTYELLFGHSTNAVMWVRLLPVPRSMRGRNVRHAVEAYVNGFSGSVVSDWLDGAGVARRVATQIVESKSVKVDGWNAHEVTFDIANLDQLQLDPNAPRSRARIIFVEAGLRKEILRSGGTATVPAILVLGYLNDAKAFDAETAAFEGLVQRVKIGAVE